MSDLHIVVLAAGKSTRMKSARPKVLQDLGGLPLITHVLRTVSILRAASTTLIVGHGAEEVIAAVSRDWPSVKFAVQSPQLGTGHALLMADSALKEARGAVLVLSGDVPLLSAETITGLLDTHRSSGAAATVLTTTLGDPSGYGRVLRNDSGEIGRIVEHRDASADERRVSEINTGIYVFALDGLFAGLKAIATDNAQHEYYLTDMVAVLQRNAKRTAACLVPNGDELRGVNTRVDLADLSALVRTRKNHALMLSGVTLEDPATVYIDEDVTIGSDSTIGASVHLSGRTSISANCRIHAGVRLTNATIGENVTVLDHSVVVDSTIGDRATVGPFAHIRPASVIGPDVRIGNFVELKKTTIGRRSKANHLAYLGDATIGEDVNIGAGTITCNYDGEHKHPTIIEDRVFIGSDSQLIAPVVIGADAYVAAGSSITKDVPKESLAISRGRQQNKDGWVRMRRENSAATKKTHS